MNKALLRTLALALGFALISPTAHADDKERWATDLQAAKKSRNGFMTAGAIAGIAGIGAYIAGTVEVSDAAETEGCEADGLFDITCVDEQSRSEAQSKLDSGQRKSLIGVAVFLVGGGLFLIGANKGNTVRKLEKQGKENGWAFNLEMNGPRGVMLMASRRY